RGRRRRFLQADVRRRASLVEQRRGRRAEVHAEPRHQRRHRLRVLMKRFLADDFLLDSATAVDLYERFARRQPIIDYHCHLSPQQIADDHRWRSITEIWLEGDHYKWRAMRTAGVPERNITGDASDWEKFAAWAGTMPQTLRNPLYHWTHLEIAFPFGVKGERRRAGTAARDRDRGN